MEEKEALKREIVQKFANYVRRSGQTYRDLASKFGISKSSVERLLNGKAIPTARIVMKMLRMYDKD